MAFTEYGKLKESLSGGRSTKRRVALPEQTLKQKYVGRKVSESTHDTEEWEDKIKSAEGSIMLGSESFEMDSSGFYKDKPTEKDVLSLFDAYMDVETWLRTVGLAHLIEDLGNDIDFGSRVAEAMDDEGYNEGTLTHDNTYNWSWLGPWDINFSQITYDGERVTFFEIHRGGDVRGNYSTPYVHSDSYEMQFLEDLLQVNASIDIEFVDGGSIRAYNQQDSDIWYFEVEVDKSSPMAEQFEEVCSDIGNGYELDEFLTEFLR